MRKGEGLPKPPYFEQAPFDHAIVETAGNKVRIISKEYLPKLEKGETLNYKEAIVFYQGWGTDVDAASYELLCQSLADSFGRQVIAIDSRAENIVDDSLDLQAAACQDYLKEGGVEKAIIAGYSQGGALAVNLAVHLQNNPEIDPQALVLLAPVGLSEQSPAELIRHFLQDTAIETLPRIGIENVSFHPDGEPTRMGKATASLQAAKDIGQATLREITESGTSYPRRFLNEVREMAKLNPHLAEINVPVFLVQGKYDKPVGPRDDLQREQMPQSEFMRDDKGNIVRDEKGKPILMAINEDNPQDVQTTLEEIFPNSPHCRRLLVKRSSNHAFPLLRAKQLSKVIKYLHTRSQRKKAEPAEDLLDPSPL